MNAFADSLESIPRSLAENAGLDPIDKLAALRAANDKNNNIGLNVFTGECVDMLKEGVIEPLKIKLQAIESAAEAAELILRIDDVISSGGKGRPAMPPGMGGMGGMPDMGM